jgi:hypothetical protein
MTARIDEIAPDLYRISVYVKDLDLQFNHFLIKDGMFPYRRRTESCCGQRQDR